MSLFKEKRILCSFLVGIALWLTLPFTSPTTRNIRGFEYENGHFRVASFYKHPNPPMVDSKVFQQLVWRHKTFTIFWLSFWGSRSGEYGLFRVEPRGRSRKEFFVPVTIDEASKLAAEVNVSISATPPISNWSLYYGWLVLVPFGLILYWDRDFYVRLKRLM